MFQRVDGAHHSNSILVSVSIRSIGKTNFESFTQSVPGRLYTQNRFVCIANPRCGSSSTVLTCTRFFCSPSFVGFPFLFFIFRNRYSARVVCFDKNQPNARTKNREQGDSGKNETRALARWNNEQYVNNSSNKQQQKYDASAQNLASDQPQLICIQFDVLNLSSCSKVFDPDCRREKIDSHARTQRASQTHIHITQADSDPDPDPYTHGFIIIIDIDIVWCTRASGNCEFLLTPETHRCMWNWICVVPNGEAAAHEDNNNESDTDSYIYLSIYRWFGGHAALHLIPATVCHVQRWAQQPTGFVRCLRGPLLFMKVLVHRKCRRWWRRRRWRQQHTRTKFGDTFSI